MRFAPPRSAPSESRKCPSKEPGNDYSLSGWAIKSVQPDIHLLRQSLSSGPRRCNSATERGSTTSSLIVNFSRSSLYSRQRKQEVLNGLINSRVLSRDSGVDTDSGVDNMTRKEEEEEEEEFSDISESNDGSLHNEISLVGLTISDREFSDCGSESELSRDSLLISRDPSHDGPVTMETSNTNTITISQPPPEPVRSVVQRKNVNIAIKQTIRKTSLASRNKKAKMTQRREHQIPHPVTPDIPESPAPPKQQLWSRCRKLERSSTSPSICCYNDAVVTSPQFEPKKDPDHYLNNFDHVLQANRPPYRNEKRRVSIGLKSSCSIPSFSTPSQALLLIGMKPANKTQSIDTNRGHVKPAIRRPFQGKPPLSNRPREGQGKGNVLELPALSVNGAGDLVIRKKQIISG